MINERWANTAVVRDSAGTLVRTARGSQSQGQHRVDVELLSMACSSLGQRAAPQPAAGVTSFVSIRTVRALMGTVITDLL